MIDCLGGSRLELSVPVRDPLASREAITVLVRLRLRRSVPLRWMREIRNLVSQSSMRWGLIPVGTSFRLKLHNPPKQPPQKIPLDSPQIDEFYPKNIWHEFFVGAKNIQHSDSTSPTEWSKHMKKTSVRCEWHPPSQFRETNNQRMTLFGNNPSHLTHRVPSLRCRNQSPPQMPQNSKRIEIRNEDRAIICTIPSAQKGIESQFELTRPCNNHFYRWIKLKKKVSEQLIPTSTPSSYSGQTTPRMHAELVAILHGMEASVSLNNSEIYIAFDCLAALAAICNPDISRSHLIARIINSLSNNENIYLCWVRGHKGIDGLKVRTKLPNSQVCKNCGRGPIVTQDKVEEEIRMDNGTEKSRPLLYADICRIRRFKLSIAPESVNQSKSTINGIKKLDPKYKININVDRIGICEALIDTGADLSVVDLSTALNTGLEIINPDKMCSGPDGKEFDIVGNIILNIKFDNKTITH
ncbi:hypothetical protein LAZ67_11002628 [Cordylochernes scorpioides]|uniref:Peptidase A2 domain-containing protein n=1 Tax=Cordylochernes scorpioides TaxID=51811 RepID=A0ABY6L049_9ARAC|nr:hypothetical protein LAZ67_11002628 [Cordylochernes scorpioides]